MIVLKLEDKTIELNTHDVEGQSLYRVQDLAKGYGITGRKLSDSVRHWKESKANTLISRDGESQAGQGFEPTRQNDVMGIVQLRGGNDRSKTGTYVTKELLFDYAMYLSKDFHRAVLHAFALLTEGKMEEAAGVATSVAISQEMIDKEMRLRSEMLRLVEEKVGSEHYHFSNFYRLLCKAVSGYTPAELTGKNGSTFSYIRKMGHTECAGAYLACLELVIVGLNINLNYHQIAAMLSVKTGKNVNLLVENLVS